MIRRLGATALRCNKSVDASCSAIVVSRRHLEPTLTWWIASWYYVVQYVCYFWAPFLISDCFFPALVNTKMPHIHFVEERKAELKLRRELDNVTTSWGNEVDASTFSEALSRTF